MSNQPLKPQQPTDRDMEHTVGHHLHDGQSVYVITNGAITLGKVGLRVQLDGSRHIDVDGVSYTMYGSTSDGSRIVLVHPATEDNREKLVALFGEAQVPTLPPQGSALTRALVKQGRYVKAWVSNVSDGKAREYKNVALLVPSTPTFLSVTGSVYDHAIAFDDFGNEITEIPNM